MYHLAGEGHELVLGKSIGHGGEGKVFQLRDQPGYVAKIYHHPDPERESKVEALISLDSGNLESSCCWPLQAIRDDHNRVVGFTMRCADSTAKPVHNLFTPISRRQTFPRADWRFLIRTATNIARAFAVCHERGVVIGDVNENGILVSQDSKVTIIDCDSFQVISDGRIFRCRVGVPTYTPPELQSQSLNNVERNINHDLFGLAVLSFQLLFMGRHPFVGRYSGQGQMPLEQAIKEHRFAFGAQRRKFLMDPPPHALALSDLPDSLVTLFERAFASDAPVVARPGAREWIRELGRLEEQLIPCVSNPGHFYPRTRSCAWCRIERDSSVRLFPAVVVVSAMFGRAARGFDLESVWREIQSVASPGVCPDITGGLDRRRMRPSGTAWRIQFRRAIHLLLAVSLAVAGLFLGAAWLVVACIAAVLVIAGQWRKLPKNIVARHRLIAGHWADLVERWRQEAGDSEFEKLKEHLNNIQTQYRALPDLLQRRINQLDSQKHKVQLQRHLERARIEEADISGIGPSRRATLRSWGIATAADVTEARLAAIPGFGGTGVLAGNVIAWRQRVERRFSFDPTKATDPAADASVRSEISLLASQYESELSKGATALRALASRATTTRESLASDIQVAWADYAQVQADRRFLLARQKL